MNYHETLWSHSRLVPASVVTLPILLLLSLALSLLHLVNLPFSIALPDNFTNVWQTKEYFLHMEHVDFILGCRSIMIRELIYIVYFR